MVATWRLGAKGTDRGSADPLGCPSLGSAAPNHFWLVGCVLGLGLVFLCLGPGLSGKWSFPFLYLFKLFSWPFLCICTHVLLQMSNHQNLWNLLVIIPNTKFGVYMSRFYARFGG